MGSNQDMLASSNASDFGLKSSDHNRRDLIAAPSTLPLASSSTTQVTMPLDEGTCHI